MPRSTPKSRQNVKGNACGLQTAALPSAPIVSSKVASTVSKRGRVVKKEPGSGTETVTEQVFHRKSERRRVARDIFLVFEEQPSTRRSRGSNKKQAKPKFGHLKVEEPVKLKGLLRDIKNEPKCYLSNDSTAGKSLVKETVKEKNVNKDSKTNVGVWSPASCPPCKSIYSKGNGVKHSKASPDVQVHSNVEEVPIVARVNPIFLWAKQDNTRIIEVRCEDYDKRNRIRITKTSNGWRAIPRSDPTSSKVLKLYTSPLIKVKREGNTNVASHISQTPANNFSVENKPLLNSSDMNMLQPKGDISLIEITTEKTRNTSAKKSRKKSKKSKKKLTCGNVVLYSDIAVIDKGQHVASPKPPVDNLSKNNCLSKDFCEKQIIVVEKNIPVLKEDCPPQEFTVPAVADEDGQQIMNGSSAKSPSFEKPFSNDSLTEGSFHDECSFQLCPKTGLFLRNSRGEVDISASDNMQIIECNSNKSIDMDGYKKLVAESKHISIDENHESLEAKTRNLKDLLDEADLFQHCDDNANSDADLIDTIVKSSCENNLLHDSESNIKEALDPLQNKNINVVSAEGDGLSQLMTDVSEPPKCLSFNEAGEIEALNCELFQSNAYMDAFDKQASTTVSDTLPPIHTVASMQPMSMLEVATQDSLSVALDLVNSDKSSYNITKVVEDSPKDLSYKKREEVCPPSESRSQCAVTSSSDVIKSPNLDDSSALASSSETLKNLILEQFIKLNTITNHKKNQVGLDKSAKNIKLFNSVFAKDDGTPSTDIETVVIDDDDTAVVEVSLTEGEAEPMKKRLRSNAVVTQVSVEADTNIKAKMVMIDKDPDPLTQLRLLTRNSQWKVPDPILVPKDRLSAVLASPAREIPLLITTRPELRLPEAFAYPEIIQNPNILVISMAQLEAILKNDMEISKSKDTSQELVQVSSLHFKQNSNQNQKKNNCNIDNEFNLQNQLQAKQTPTVAELLQRENDSTPTIPANSLSKEEVSKCSHLGASMPSEVNAATMAVLNQMLWLPYFGQLSQDFIKSIKAPYSLTEKMASLLPFCGTQNNLESMCEKNTQTSLSSLQNVHNESGGHYGNTALPSSLKQGQSEEISLFQKVLQQQMQNTVNTNQFKNTHRGSQSITPNHSSIEQISHTEPLNIGQTNVRPTNSKSTYSSKSNKVAEQSSGNIFDVAGKTYNLRSSIASRQNSDPNYYSNMKRHASDTKPRVTCKSLSNLLDPEHSQPHNMSLTSNHLLPVVSNVEGNFLQNINGLKGHSTDNKNSGRAVESNKDKTLKSLIRPCTANNLEIVNEYNKKDAKIMDDISSETAARNLEHTMLPTETNVPLWHPLFGSNSKSAYSSPWQWTTVTAAGE